MNKKIICIGIIGMFLLTGLIISVPGKNVTDISISEQTIKSNLVNIGVRCYDIPQPFGLSPWLAPGCLNSTITITDISTGDIVVKLTKKDGTEDNVEHRRTYIVEDLEDGEYKINCSLKLPKVKVRFHYEQYIADPEYAEEIITLPGIAGHYCSTTFIFDSHTEIVKSHPLKLRTLSLFISRLPLIQRLLKL
jgi:hypothetical protein